MPSLTMAASVITYLENQLAILRSDSLLRRVVIKELAPPSTRESEAAAQSKEDQDVGGKQPSEMA